MDALDFQFKHFPKKYVGVPLSTKVQSFYTHILMDNIIKFKKFAHNI
ncbi:hypothetical protein CLOSPO_01547 [Clostridium sporogenes ATCC 15579]|nr:hypothetical protein CLOSPO_01547 [Clostridium sporogenes ATCC 15579]